MTAIHFFLNNDIMHTVLFSFDVSWAAVFTKLRYLPILAFCSVFILNMSFSYYQFYFITSCEDIQTGVYERIYVCMYVFACTEYILKMCSLLFSSPILSEGWNNFEGGGGLLDYYLCYPFLFHSFGAFQGVNQNI